MASFNRVILLGNITREFEIRYLQSGTAVTELGLAVNDRYKNQTGEWVDEVTFVDVTLWGRTAEIAGEYLSKGAPVLIEGRLKLHQWEKDGQKHSKLRVTCDRLQMLPKAGGTGGGGGNRTQNQNFDEGGEYGDAPSGPPARSSAPQHSGAPQRSSQPSAPPPPTEDEIPF